MTFQDQWLMYIYMNQSGYKKEVNSCVFNQNILKISKNKPGVLQTHSSCC